MDSLDKKFYLEIVLNPKQVYVPLFPVFMENPEH